MLSLAIVGEGLTNFESMVRGHTPIAPELRIVSKLPHLAPGCKFSVKAKNEVEIMTMAQKTIIHGEKSWNQQNSKVRMFIKK